MEKESVQREWQNRETWKNSSIGEGECTERVAEQGNLEKLVLEKESIQRGNGKKGKFEKS